LPELLSGAMLLALWVLEADDEVIGMAFCDNWRVSK
jgi:hypothetical protein